MHHTVLVLFLLGLCLQNCNVAEAAAAAGPARALTAAVDQAANADQSGRTAVQSSPNRRMKCSLNIVGDGSPVRLREAAGAAGASSFWGEVPPVTDASLSCTGGTLSIYYDKESLGKFAKQFSKGVKVDPNCGCGAGEAPQPPKSTEAGASRGLKAACAPGKRPPCMLVVCGASAPEVEFISPHITGVSYAHSSARSIVCFQSRSKPPTKYILEDADISGNHLVAHMPASKGASAGASAQSKSYPPTGGIIQFVTDGDVEVRNSQFGSNKVESYVTGASGGALHFTTLNNTLPVSTDKRHGRLLIDNTVFANNKLLKANLSAYGCNYRGCLPGALPRSSKEAGGAVFAQGMRVDIQHSEFTNNTAYQNGGALGLAVKGVEAWENGKPRPSEIGQVVRANVTIHNTTFSGNTAHAASTEAVPGGKNAGMGGQGGGAVFIVGARAHVNVSNTALRKNHATGSTGGAISVAKEAPTGLPGEDVDFTKRMLNCSNRGAAMSYLGTKQYYEYCFDEVSMNISHTQAQNNMAMDNGGAMWIDKHVHVGFDNFSTKSDPGEPTTNAGCAGTDIYGMFDARLNFINSSVTPASSTVFWPHMNCVPGEVAPQGKLCSACPINCFSFDPKKDTQCYPCVAHATCAGGDDLQPMPGYWHSNPRWPQVHRCPLFTAACGEKGQCNAGYEGPVCGQCAPGYGSRFSLKCSKCLPFKSHMAVYVLGAIASVALLAYIVHATWVDNKEGSRDTRPSHQLKILVQFLQYLLIISTLDAPWPEPLAVLFRAVSVTFSAVTGEVVSLDCLLGRSSRGPPLMVKRQLMHLLAPGAAVAALALLELAWWGIARLHFHMVRTGALSARRRQLAEPSPLLLWQKLPVMVLVVMFVSFPSLVRVALSFFACLPLDTLTPEWANYAQYATYTAKRGYVVGELSQACYEGWHTRWALGLGLPCLLIFCIGVPVGILVGLWTNRSRLQEREFRMHVGFLYRNFRSKMFFWEAVWAVVTIILIVISTFRFNLGSYYSCLLLNVAFAGSAMLQIGFKPFASRSLHLLQLLATTCLYFTSVITLSLFTNDMEAGAASTRYAIAISVIAIIINVAFICACLWAIIQSSKGPVLQVARTISTMLQARVSRTSSDVSAISSQASKSSISTLLSGKFKLPS